MNGNFGIIRAEGSVGRLIGKSINRGQAMLEYLLALSGLIVVVAILCVFVATAMRTADRTERLACSEYP